MGFLNRLFGKEKSPAEKLQVKKDLTIENFSVRRMAFSPDGRSLVVAGGKTASGGGKISINLSGRICILDSETLKEVKDLGDGFLPQEVCFCDAGKSVVGIMGARLSVWNAGTGKLTRTLEEDIELGSISSDGASPW